MKKVLIISLLLFSLGLSSCSLFGESDDIKDAKRELLGDSYSNDNNKITETIKKEEPIIEDKVEKVLVTKEFITDEEYFTIDNILKPTNSTVKIDFNGKTDFLVDKIEVTFKNEESNFPDDDYTLKSFKTGNKEFVYRAYKKYEVLDYGVNEYVISAYFGDKVSKMKITIEIPKEEKLTNTEVIKTISKTIGKEDNNIFLKLPENDDFGDVVMMGEDSFTYSNIENLEIVKSMEIFDKTCDNLTDYLINKFGWAYRNTCRQLNTDKGITFNVIRLEGDKYYYERHYLDELHGLYGVYQIENGSGVDKKNIGDKNSELKIKEFDGIKVVDDLFKIIAK